MQLHTYLYRKQLCNDIVCNIIFADLFITGWSVNIEGLYFRFPKSLRFNSIELDDVEDMLHRL